MGSAHFGLGMGMRNRWGLWGRNALTEHMHERNIHHPDSMSSEILHALYAKWHR